MKGEVGDSTFYSADVVESVAQHNTKKERMAGKRNPNQKHPIVHIAKKDLPREKNSPTPYR